MPKGGEDKSSESIRQNASQKNTLKLGKTSFKNVIPLFLRGVLKISKILSKTSSLSSDRNYTHTKGKHLQAILN